MRSTLRIFQLQTLNITQTTLPKPEVVGKGDACSNLSQTTPDSAQNFFGICCGLTMTSSNTLLIRLLSTTSRKIKHLFAFSKLHFHEHTFLILSAHPCPASKFSRASSKVTYEYVNRNSSVLKIIIFKSKVSLFMRNILLVGENCQ